MARKLSPEREREIVELLSYLEIFVKHVWQPRHTSGSTLQAHFDAITAEFGRSRALEGLRQAANDTVESLSDEAPQVVDAFDRLLNDSGALTFSEVRRRYSAAYKRLLSRGSIRTETEYYMVAGILADQTSQVSAQERARLQELSNAFESDALYLSEGSKKQ